MDKECKELCEAVNLLPGIRTIESCCGHGKIEYHIWFITEGLDHLPALLYWLSACHSGQSGWLCRVTTDCAMSPVTFLIEGPKGDKGYKASIEIASCIRERVNEEKQ